MLKYNFSCDCLFCALTHGSHVFEETNCVVVWFDLICLLTVIWFTLSLRGV